MIYLVPIALILGLVIGFCTFKRSNRWCPACGHVLRCESCRRAVPAGERRA